MIKSVRYESVNDCRYCEELKHAVNAFLADATSELHIQWRTLDRSDPDFEEQCAKLKSLPEVAARQHTTFPFVWIDDVFVGGCSEAKAILEAQRVLQATNSVEF